MSASRSALEVSNSSAWQGQLKFFHHGGHTLEGLIICTAANFWATFDTHSMRASLGLELDEQITEYQCITSNLVGKQTSLAKHDFVCFRTKKHWWSLEKEKEGITLQRSEDIESVRQFWGGQKRTKVREEHTRQSPEGSGYCSLRQLLEFLRAELENPYNVFVANCQTFTSDVVLGVVDIQADAKTLRHFEKHNQVARTVRAGKTTIGTVLGSFVISMSLILVAAFCHWVFKSNWFLSSNTTELQSTRNAN